jgi:general secretion pathway protein A
MTSPLRPQLVSGEDQTAFRYTAATPLYEKFFGLQERPFDLVPNPRFLFLSEIQKEVLSTLRYGLTGPGGITLLIGEAGTGKTTLAQTACAELGVDRVQIVQISNPTLTRNEFYESLASGFSLGSQAITSKAWFLAALREYAEQRHQEGRLSAILLDEAQSLPHELLEEVRLLSNLETNTAKLLNVVLAGQPELATRLNQPELRQLKQRVGLRCELRPFDIKETAAYIAGRVRIAGGSPVEIFTREAVGTVFEASGGIPRVINVLCENALIGGFAAQTKPVPRAIVEDVVRDFDLGARGGEVKPRVVAAPAVPVNPDAQRSGAPVTSTDSASVGMKNRKRPSFF